MKLMQPLMPTYADLEPYLTRIDESRQYSNNGPLVQELESRLSAWLGLPVYAVCNGTVALELLLRAQGIGPMSRVVVPAMTFAATGLAVQATGARAMLVDVEKSTWVMTPDIAKAQIANYGVPSAVVPVCSFGAPLDSGAWAIFAEHNRAKVIIDAAGALTQQKIVKHALLSYAFSLHATKFVGCGEGGVVCTGDPAVMKRARVIGNFGAGGTNAKMSEYHAAVALASMDMVHTKHMHSARILEAYSKHLPPRFTSQHVTFGDRTLMPVLVPVGQSAQHVMRALTARGIESKQWYRPFLDESIGHAGRAALPVTDDLRARMIGLPFHAFLSEIDVVNVCVALDEICNKTP